MLSKNVITLLKDKHNHKEISHHLKAQIMKYKKLKTQDKDRLQESYLQTTSIF